MDECVRVCGTHSYDQTTCTRATLDVLKLEHKHEPAHTHMPHAVRRSNAHRWDAFKPICTFASSYTQKLSGSGIGTGTGTGSGSTYTTLYAYSSTHTANYIRSYEHLYIIDDDVMQRMENEY